MGTLPLFEEYPGLEGRIPWRPLGSFPTPVRRLERLGGHVGIREFYLKDDGLSSKYYGGNKVRKLEFLLAEAIERGAEGVLTVGGAGSNHVLATTIHAGRLGLKTVAVLFDQPPSSHVRRNLLLDLYFGAELIHASKRQTSSTIKRLIAERGNLHYIPVGGSTELGCLGFVNAGFELKRQVEEGLLPEPDYLFVAAGSMGTAAGLYLGCKLSGLKTRVVGVRVASRRLCSPERWAALINRTSAFLHQADPSIPRVKASAQSLLLLEGYVGRGYGWFTEEGVKAISLMRRLEGVSLEGTYTGKALAGTIDYVGKHGLKGKVILFWNTYNAVDLSKQAGEADYRRLPKPLQKYFEEPCQRLDPGEALNRP